MDKKRILIVSRAFYPTIAPRSFRATELAKELARQGHNVTVLTHKHQFDYNEFEKTHHLRTEDFVKGKWSIINGKNIFIKGLQFLLNYFFLFPDIQLSPLLKKHLQNKSGYDLLISIAVPYPVHWGVALAKKKNTKLCKVWIADCGDPFMGNKEQIFKHPFYFKYVENWFCKRADYLTVPIKEAVNAFPDFCKHKIKVIPQGFNFGKITTSNENITNPFPIFVYAGALSKGIRDPSEFMEYLCSKTNQDFKFIIFTKSVSIIEPYKTILKEKLEIRDYIPREQLLSELRQMDFLVNFENKNIVQSPSKLIDYALIGRPVISIQPFALNKQVVDEFLTSDYSNQFVISDIEQYNIVNVANQFLNLANS